MTHLTALQMSGDEAEKSDESLPASTALSSASPSRDLTPPVTPDSVSPPRQITVEDRTAQLRATITSVSQEHDSLATQLKMARRESQRSEAAIRAEIEALKRAAEKQAVSDQRAKQKVLALQEAVKQSHSATTDIEAQARALENDLPRVRQEEALIEVEYADVREAAAKKEAEVEQAVRADKKKIAEVQAELGGLSNRLDKVTAKRDKLSTETIPELEQQLAEIQRDIEQIEAQKEDARYALSSISENALGSQAGYNNYRGPLRQAIIQRPAHRTTASGNQPRSSYPPINASAAPFYPRGQPSILHRPPPGLPSTRPNDFRPFDTSISHVESNSSFPYPQPLGRSSNEFQEPSILSRRTISGHDPASARHGEEY